MLHKLAMPVDKLGKPGSTSRAQVDRLVGEVQRVALQPFPADLLLGRTPGW